MTQGICRCDGSGWIVVCIDDICRSNGSCFHEDGEIPCPCQDDDEQEALGKP